MKGYAIMRGPFLRASDSDATARQQIQSNDIASNDPRLAKK